MLNKVLKILGILFVPFLVLLIVMYFLYPRINPEGYQEIVERFDETSAESARIADFRGMDINPQHMDSLQAEMNRLLAERQNLEAVVDSLMTQKEQMLSVIDTLESQRDSVEMQTVSLNERVPEGLEETAASTQSSEEFAERVKSLLNLEEEELAPILSNLEDPQLIRLYYSAGSIQREKLLRSLSPERAARIMQKIML
ncbi:MAG: hypothetical protein LAT84_07175 [Balneolia bacterium]|nr:hypothetical protein [Balneolia bacterium]